MTFGSRSSVGPGLLANAYRYQDPPTELTVNSTADTTDGACTTDAGGCTLREAITAANANAVVETITFDLPGAGAHTIQLSSALPTLSSMSVSSGESITVRGEGSADPYLIFTINSGSTVTISGLTISNGAARTGSRTGGGIFNRGTLNVVNSTVSGNSAYVDGGGIYNDLGGTLTLTNSTVTDNTAEFDGGGIFNQSGTLILTNSTVNDNLATRYGGGITNFNGTLTLTRSTVSNNFAQLCGGGIRSFGGGTVTLSNSTVSGNNSAQCGGGIFNDGSTLKLTSATITRNRADSDNNG